MTNHGSSYTHIRAIFTIILSSFILIGSLFIVITTIKSLSRLVKSQKAAAFARRDSAETKASEAEEEELRKGGARRLRKVLVICLLSSDGLIALSSIGPAIGGMTGSSLSGKECDPPGFILAASLWWQYGFSLVVAITTYIALRHPLSTIKRNAENKWSLIVAIVLFIGGLQAVLWRVLHGFVEWKDYCSYGPPSSTPAELMHFLPRMITSLLIAVIYLPLIHFLRRPDLSSLYLSPRPASFSFRTEQIHQPDIPPWERLSFPNFGGLGLTNFDDDFDQSTLGPSRSVSNSLVGASFIPLSMGFRPILPPQPVYLGHELSTSCSGSEKSQRMERGSMQSDTTLIHSSLTVKIISSPRQSMSLLTPLRKQSTTSTIIHTPLSSLGTATPLRNKRLATPTGCMCKDIEKDQDTEEGKDFASFRGMLDYVPCPRHRQERSMDDQSKTPNRESMASFMNKRTMSLLIWFPLTHLIICAITLARFVYRCVVQQDDKTVKALTLVSLLGQGVSDIIVFGLIERRTQKRYRREVAACTPHDTVDRRQ